MYDVISAWISEFHIYNGLYMFICYMFGSTLQHLNNMYVKVIDC